MYMLPQTEDMVGQKSGGKKVGIWLGLIEFYSNYTPTGEVLNYCIL